MEIEFIKPIDYLSKLIEHRINYNLNVYDCKVLVLNFIENNKEQTINILERILNDTLDYKDLSKMLYDCILKYKFNEETDIQLFELILFLINKKVYPTLEQTIELIDKGSDNLLYLFEYNTMDFNFKELKFGEYYKILNYTDKYKLRLLRNVGLKFNNSYDLILLRLGQGSLFYNQPIGKNVIEKWMDRYEKDKNK